MFAVIDSNRDVVKLVESFDENSTCIRAGGFFPKDSFSVIETDVDVDVKHPRNYTLDDNDVVILKETDSYREEKLTQIRIQRDILMQDAFNVRDRHKDELELIQLGRVLSTTITNNQYNELIIYIQRLRDLPEEVNVNEPIFPIKPY